MKDYNFLGNRMWIMEDGRAVHFTNNSVTTEETANAILKLWEEKGFDYIWKRAKRAPAPIGNDTRVITRV